jgi:uncharacterized membrane protein YdfJ with MMPL/SSD domain
VKLFDSGRSVLARCTTARGLLALAAVAALAPVLPLHAAPPSAAGANDPMQAAKQVHVEYMQLQNRLAQIQKKTIEANPELQKQEKAFMELMMSKMTIKGTTPKEELAALEKLKQKLGSKETPESERKALLDEYRAKASAFGTAQMKALQDPEVAKAREALMTATLAAMKKQDPQSEELMQQMQQKQQEMQQIMQSAGHDQ